MEGQTQLVKKIKELTMLNSKHSDEDYEDDELISQTYKIKSLIANINTNDVKLIVKECEELGWESYAAKVKRAVSGKPEYEKILERIQATVHSDQFRIDCMLFTALFEQVNGQAVSQFIEVYSVVVELFLKYLTACRREVETISESSKISNICTLPKTTKFITSLYYNITWTGNRWGCCVVYSNRLLACCCVITWICYRKCSRYDYWTCTCLAVYIADLLDTTGITYRTATLC